MIRMKCVLMAFLAGCRLAAGEGADSKPASAPEPPVAQQQRAVAAMAASLAAQRAAIARQMGQNASGSFFLLAPPSSPELSFGASPAYRIPAGDCAAIPDTELDPLIEGAARQQNLRPSLLKGIIQQESAFRPCAVSPKGAMGLMQLMPGTAAQLGVKDPFDPKENVEAGARFLSELLKIYKDLPTALGAYNAGPRKVDESGGIPPIPETLNYIQRILSGPPDKP